MADKRAAQIQPAFHGDTRCTLDLLCEQFTENYLLGEIFRTNDNAIRLPAGNGKSSGA
jgi:hypothetical protein